MVLRLWCGVECANVVVVYHNAKVSGLEESSVGVYFGFSDLFIVVFIYKKLRPFYSIYYMTTAY